MEQLIAQSANYAVVNLEHIQEMRGWLLKLQVASSPSPFGEIFGRSVGSSQRPFGDLPNTSSIYSLLYLTFYNIVFTFIFYVIITSLILPT